MWLSPLKGGFIVYRNKGLETQHLKRSLAELLPFAIIGRSTFDNWFLNDYKISIPYIWNNEKIVTFTNSFKQDRLFDEEELYLKAWFGGESLVKIDGKSYGEVNQFHREIDLTPFCDGNEHVISVTTVPRGLFGSKEEPVFKYAFLVKYNKQFRDILIYTLNVISVAEETENESLAKYLIEITNDFLQSIDFQRDIETYKSGLYDNLGAGEVTTTWTPVELIPSGGLFNEELFSALKEKFEKFRRRLLKAPFKKNGTVYVTGHAHIDYAWLWPVEETKRKIIRTFANAVTLAKKYNYFIYSQSSAQMYQDLKELDHQLFEEVKKLIDEGRWELAGGMWVESDSSIPAVESLIRQFYYGQKFFEKEFNKRSDFCWLPDVFGFSWALPQILIKSGIKYFVTTKLNWNESNRFPYDICLWQGIDGSKVLYYSFKNDEEGYNGKVSARSIINSMNNFRQKELTDKILISVGYGDGGGGPTEEMCKNYTTLNEIPGIPNVKFSTVSEYLNSLSFENIQLPVWNDELYLELHRGTLTSQGKMKRLHKIAEETLRKAEIINAISEGDNQEKIDELWKVLLKNEFHDILPGSSIREVYKQTVEELTYVIEECEKIIKSSLKESDTLTLINTSSFEQKCIFESEENLSIENFKKLGTYDRKYLYYSDISLNPLEISELNYQKSEKLSNSVKKSPVESYEIENESMKFVVNSDGTVNIFLKEIGKWVFKGNGGNKLVIGKDVPYYWDNWDVDINHSRYFFRPTLKGLNIVEKNDIRDVIEVIYEYDKSNITQYYIFWKKEGYVEVRSKVFWKEKRVILKALFETDIKSRYAKYDIDGGYVERSTTNNTTFEQARFEVLAHRWVDLSQYDFGVSVINDCKYGHSVKNGTIAISLVKSGIYPDFEADIGLHEFSYLIYPHLKLDVAQIVKLADNYNKPVVAYFGKIDHKNVFSFDKKTSKILSLRKIANSYYLRFCEIAGGYDKIKIKSNRNFKNAYFVNLLDDVETEIETEIVNNGSSVEFELKPFEIKTIRIDL